MRPENLMNTISQKPTNGISPNSDHRSGFIDVLIRFWGQKVKDQDYSL